MARNARPTAAKREREKALIERRQQKAAKREDTKRRKAEQGPNPDGVRPGYRRHHARPAAAGRLAGRGVAAGRFIGSIRTSRSFCRSISDKRILQLNSA